MANSADPVEGVAQILGVFIGYATAAAFAPHLVVLIGGFAGGVLGLMSWRRCTSREGASYILGMGMLAWLLTGSAAELLAGLWPWLGDRATLAPLAIVIGAVGHRWPAVGKWAGRLLRSWAEAAFSSGARK